MPLAHGSRSTERLVCKCYRTFLKDCPFRIKVRATKDGQKLYIKEISGEHNHELSEVKIIVYVTK